MAKSKMNVSASSPGVVRRGPTDAAAVGRHIGAKVRRLRSSLGLTLGEVTKRSGISRPMLSRLETGDVMPSLETIVALTNALGVGLSSLFSELGAGTGSAQHVHGGEGLEVVRRGTRRGHTYHLLAADRGPRRAFEPFLVTLTDKSEVFPEFEHPGVEFIYLLEGSLTYRHGEGSYLLKPGDALTFPGSIPHGPEKLVRLPIRMLSIIIYAATDSE